MLLEAVVLVVLVTPLAVAELVTVTLTIKLNEFEGDNDCDGF